MCVSLIVTLWLRHSWLDSAEDKVLCSHCWRLLHFHAHDRRVPGLVSA